MTSSLFDLSGRVAVVSGAARGMGRRHGAWRWPNMVPTCYWSIAMSTAPQQTARDSSAIRSSRLWPRSATSSNSGQIGELFAQLDREFGRIDFLANVAGEGVLVPPEELLGRTIAAGVREPGRRPVCMCQEAGRRMLRAGRGSIVNIGSLASTTALGRGHIAYSMAMGAVVQMTRELSTEWAGSGVRVNAILPAQVVNPSLEQRIAADPGMKDVWLRGIPAGRLGQPDDIRGLAVLLASDASSWITGALIPMDGGNLAMNGGGSLRPRPQ